MLITSPANRCVCGVFAGENGDIHLFYRGILPSAVFFEGKGERLINANLPRPAAFVAAGSLDLRFDAQALTRLQNASIFRHPGGGFKFPDRVGELETVLVFDPAAGIAGEPGAIGRPRDQKRDRFVVRFVDEIGKLVDEHPIDLLAIDPVACFLPGAENHAAALVKALSEMHLLTENGLAVFLLHHPKKGAAAVARELRPVRNRAKTEIPMIRRFTQIQANFESGKVCEICGSNSPIVATPHWPIERDLRSLTPLRCRFDV